MNGASGTDMRKAVTDRGAPVPRWVTAGVVFGAFAVLSVLERRRSLRRRVEPQWRRDARNLAVAAVSAAALRIAEKPAIQPLAEAVERHRWGLLKQMSLPAWLEVPLAVALMDYTLYVWHVLTHRVPLLWRFHAVHHVDLDLSASTALRFHFAELVLSVPWRAAQIRLIGVSPRALSAWQTCLFVSILFHHSNLRLPIAFERRLVRLLVTPRMHGIHHSAIQDETNSNWSSGLTLWDRLHGTFRLDVPQQMVIIGVPAYRDPEEVTLPRLLAMPFGEGPPTWRWRGGIRSRQLASEPALDGRAAVSEPAPWVTTSRRKLEVVAYGLASGALAAARRHGVRQPHPVNSTPVASPASLGSPQTSAASTAGTPSQPPLWAKIAGTAYVLVLVPIYWRDYGPSNFLWFSDLALFALCAALWFDGSLLVGMAAIGVLALEIAWTIDFLCGGRLLDLAGYMFDTSKPLYLRALSLFHLAIPPAILWMLHRHGYDRRSLPLQTAFAWLVMLTTYALTDPEKNINWVFGLGSKPQGAVPPRLYLAALMVGVPLVVYLPTHLVLDWVFRPPQPSASET